MRRARDARRRLTRIAPGLPPEVIAKQHEVAIGRMEEFDALHPEARALVHETDDMVAARGLSDEIERKRLAVPPPEGEPRMYRMRPRRAT